MTGLLEGLNPEQIRAVTYDGHALMVTAVPGSGKTRVITHRMAYRIRERGMKPRRMLAVTFTNRAAAEMSARLTDLLGSEERAPIGTFHWMCAGLLRRRISLLGYRPDFQILDPRAARRLIQTLVSERGSGTNETSWRLAAAVSGMKSGVDAEVLAQRADIATARLQEVAKTYQQALRRKNLLDLDDLPFLAATLLRQHPHERERCRSAIGELLVDEYQDTNAIQQELVALLAPRNGTVLVVGDEDQAIYGWRHAGAGAFGRFPVLFPDAEVITLERSYRHHKFVARASNSLMAHGPERSIKGIRTELPAGRRPLCFIATDERDEAEWIAGEAARMVNAGNGTWEDIAILYRVNAQSRALEDALVRRHVPYRVVSGRSFYRRAHVRRVLAYLKLALDHDDDGAVAWLLESIPGVGDQRVAALRDWAAAREVSLSNALSSADIIPNLPGTVRHAVLGLASRIERVYGVRKQSLLQVVDVAIGEAEVALGEEGLMTESTLEDFGELRSLARIHMESRGTLRSLMATLAPGQSQEDGAAGVALMSLHSAKGLEYQTVFLAGLEEGLLPHARSLSRTSDLEEERRLCYVGMTRAKETLCLSYAQSRLLSGERSKGQPSRFIGEIGPQHMGLQVSTSKRVQPKALTARAGDRVQHARWGAGTVEQVDGTGQDALTTIMFDTGKRRRLQLRHTPLTVHGGNASDVSTG